MANAMLSPVALRICRKRCKYHTEFAKSARNDHTVYALQANHI